MTDLEKSIKRMTQHPDLNRMHMPNKTGAGAGGAAAFPQLAPGTSDASGKSIEGVAYQKPAVGTLNITQRLLNTIPELIGQNTFGGYNKDNNTITKNNDGSYIGQITSQRVYDKALLTALDNVPGFDYSVYGLKKSIPMHKGDTIALHRFLGMESDPKLLALQMNYNTLDGPDLKGFKGIGLQFKLAMWGNGIQINDVAQAYMIDDLYALYGAKLVQNAIDVRQNIVARILYEGASKVYIKKYSIEQAVGTSTGTGTDFPLAIKPVIELSHTIDTLYNIKGSTGGYSATPQQAGALNHLILRYLTHKMERNIETYKVSLSAPTQANGGVSPTLSVTGYGGTKFVNEKGLPLIGPNGENTFDKTNNDHWTLDKNGKALTPAVAAYNYIQFREPVLKFADGKYKVIVGSDGMRQLVFDPMYTRSEYAKAPGATLSNDLGGLFDYSITKIPNELTIKAYGIKNTDITKPFTGVHTDVSTNGTGDLRVAFLLGRECFATATFAGGGAKFFTKTANGQVDTSDKYSRLAFITYKMFYNAAIINPNGVYAIVHSAGFADYEHVPLEGKVDGIVNTGDSDAIQKPE